MKGSLICNSTYSCFFMLFSYVTKTFQRYVSFQFRIEPVGAAASKEYSLEKSIEKMKSEWVDVQFGLVKYRDTVSKHQINIYISENNYFDSEYQLRNTRGTLLLIHCGTMERCTLAQSWADVSVIIYLFIWTLVSEQLVISQTHPNKPVGLRTPPVLHGKVDSSEILTCPEETRITMQKIKSEGTSFLFTKQSVSGPSKQRCTEEIPFDTFTHLQPFPIPCCFNPHREGGNRKLSGW